MTTPNSVARYGWQTAATTYSSPYLVKPVLDIIAKYNAAKVIDIGTGNGGNLGAWATVAEQVVALEPDAEGFALAKASYPQMPIYNVGVYDDPSMVVGQPFDLALSLEVLEHLFDPHALPRFAGKVLRDEGLLLISTPYHGFLKNCALSLTNKWDFHHHPLRVGGHIKFWSRKSLEALLEQNGFTPLEFVGCGRLPFLWKSMIIVARKSCADRA